MNRLSRFLLICVCVLGAAQPALALELNPNQCFANSYLPEVYQFWQSNQAWMGVAITPQIPSNQVNLEVLYGLDPAYLQSYDPPVVSEMPGTNFFVRNYAGEPDQWGFVEGSTVLGGSLSYVMDWDPGRGIIAPGVDQVLDYGGIGWDCGLIRVMSVYLEAGKVYDFTIVTDQPGEDVRLALLGTGSRPDGWVTRQDALFEKVADDPASPSPATVSVPVTGNYALVMFVNDVTVAGGTVTFSYEEYVAPVNFPDLVVTGISPSVAAQGQPVTATVYVKNQGGAAAAACETLFQLDGSTTCATIATPALAPGGTASVTCSLGSLTGGSHHLYALVDVGDVVDEDTNNFNNDYYQTLTVTVVGGPDLIVRFASPRQTVPENSFQAYLYVQNTGQADAAASTTLLEIDGGAQRFLIPTPVIPAGTEVTLQQTVAALSAGLHGVHVTADTLDTVTEVYETNNSYSYTLDCKGPNLVVDQITPTTVIGTNVAPVYDIVVRNTGNAIAPTSYTSLTLDGVVECGAISTPQLDIGATATVQCVSSTYLTPGTHTVEAWADAGTDFREISELDNTLSVTVTVIPTSVVVRPDGSGDYPTIQAAIDAVADGGEVLLVPETFTGPGNRDLDFHGKNLTITSIYGGRALIDCQGDPENPHRAFYFHSGETNAALVRGVDITGGWQEYGSGGGIFISGAAPTIEDCVIHHCRADWGGAIAFGSALQDHPLISGCTLVANSANTGGAIALGGEIGPMLNNTLITANSSLTGAFYTEPYSSAILTLACCDVWGNNGGDYVAGAAGQNGSNGNISQDPLLCDPVARDYHVASNSPCTVEVNSACGRIGALPAGCGPMGGTVRHVQADGAGEYQTIQHALNNCVDGDIVELADGIYTGTGNWDLNTLGLAVIVRSASGDRFACRIDGQDAHRGFYFQNGEGPTTVITGIGIVKGAADNGAAIACDGASPTLDNLYLADSNATNDGGGIHCTNSSSPRIVGCLLENNSAADDAGGLYAYNYSSPVLENVDFIGNLCNARGAGALFVVNSFPTLTGCVFQGNEGIDGGGLAFVFAYGTVTDCVINDNVATYGGGVECYGNAHAAFVGCTFSGNRAANGASVYLRNNASPTFDHCLLAFGGLGEAFARYATDCNPVLTCSDIWGHEFGDWTAMIADQSGVDGNLWVDPLFCDSAGGVYTLRGDSPCAEVNNPGCGQIGALGVGCSGSWLVRPDGSGDYPTIQAAIDAAVNGESIVLADGTYTGAGNRDLNFGGKAITVRGQSLDASLCIIDCQADDTDPHHGFDFVSGETSAAALEHVTVTGAYKFYGGAINIANASSPTIRHCVLRGNGSDSGAGILIGGGSNPLLEDVVFADNNATNAGGGIYINSSFPNIVDCVFTGNHARYGGGALYNQHAGPNVLRCVFDGNTADNWGGAVHNRYGDSAPHFTDCLLTGNSAHEGGAIFARDGATPTYQNCTFVGNSASFGAVGEVLGTSSVTLLRCILAFSPSGAAMYSDGTGTATAFCCDVFGNLGGDYSGPLAGQLGVDGNISAEPYFCDRYSGVYSLGSISPCLAAQSPCGLTIGAYDEGCAVTAVDDPATVLPSRLTLAPAVPNPFNPMTVIRYELPAAASVHLDVFDLGGRRVATLVNGDQSAGGHDVVWRAVDDHGRGVSSGLYFVRLKAAGETQVQKIMLAR